MVQLEVPSPVNFHLMQDAQDWESSAMNRPFRLEMFRKFADCFEKENFNRALELGSGPGFLAKFLCDRVADISLTLLDFSEAMHELAKERLKDCRQDIDFIRRDFSASDWAEGLEGFDCVFSNQAVHELRHKSRSGSFHQQVRKMLPDGGVYLVCDHFCGQGAMNNEQLYLTAEEQISCIETAGFRAEVLLRKGSLQLVRAT